MDEGLAHVTTTLAEVDQILAQIQPQVGPLMTKLNQAADQVSGIALAAHQLLGTDDSGGGNLSEAIGQLDQAARSIRTLADYLDRHPEALVRGKRPESP
jgi:ABC-type transporter Mla subunit MlaD